MALLTQKAILSAFSQMLEEMPFDRITVSALVRRAGVSPNTFYYHYHDIYELLDVWFRSVLHSLADFNAPDFSWEDTTCALLRLFQAHPKTVYHAYDSLSRDRLERYLFSYTDDIFHQRVSRHAEGRGLTDEQLGQITSFCRCAYVGFLTQFLWNRMEPDIDRSVSQFGALVRNFVVSSVELFAAQAAAC